MFHIVDDALVRHGFGVEAATDPPIPVLPRSGGDGNALIIHGQVAAGNDGGNVHIIPEVGNVAGDFNLPSDAGNVGVGAAGVRPSAAVDEGQKHGNQQGNNEYDGDDRKGGQQPPAVETAAGGYRRGAAAPAPVGGQTAVSGWRHNGSAFSG